MYNAECWFSESCRFVALEELFLWFCWFCFASIISDKFFRANYWNKNKSSTFEYCAFSRAAYNRLGEDFELLHVSTLT